MKSSALGLPKITGARGEDSLITVVEEPEPGGGAEGGAEAGGGAGLAKPKFIRVTTLEDVQVGSFNYHIVRF